MFMFVRFIYYTYLIVENCCACAVFAADGGAYDVEGRAMQRFCIATRGAKGDIALCLPCLGTTPPFCSIIDAQLIYGRCSLTALFRFRRGRSHRVLSKLSHTIYNMSGLSHRGKSFTHRRKHFHIGGNHFRMVGVWKMELQSSESRFATYKIEIRNISRHRSLSN